MLCGNSYKTWDEQFKEFYSYWRNISDNKPIKIEVSKAKWKSWGGLKWCSEECFQGELDREGCQTEGEPDNPNPRQYKDMIFTENERIAKKVLSICK
jgi:hypothetical protein